ncbi:hypothetical protein [Microbacterium sp.]|uniref:hypothetical protein n=1 Tax=Microbacterium sp. TaxID=51671 RepID=UPI0031FF19DE|nr:hypothetical protein [Microbacterium sp.]
MNTARLTLITGLGLIVVAIALGAWLHIDAGQVGTWLPIEKQLADPRGVASWVTGVIGPFLAWFGATSLARRRS